MKFSTSAKMYAAAAVIKPHAQDQKVQQCWQKSDKLVGKREDDVKGVYTVINGEKTYVEREDHSRDGGAVKDR